MLRKKCLRSFKEFFPFHCCIRENITVINLFISENFFLQRKQGKNLLSFLYFKNIWLIHRYLNIINHVIKGFPERESAFHNDCGTSQHNLWLRKFRRNVGSVNRIVTESLLCGVFFFSLIRLSGLIAPFPV